MKTKLLMTAIASVATLSATSASAQLESLREVVYYNFDSAQSAEVEAQMQKITDLASSRNARSIRVTCHTDTTGSAAYNQALSERRAADVLNALVSRGISRNVISSQGLGETSLLVPTGDGVKEQLNRRCEIDLDVEPYVQQVQQEYVQREYVQTQPQTQTVTETVRAPDPTPIESTQITRTVPSVGQPISVPSTSIPSTSIPSTSIPSASIPSAPAIPTPRPLPPVSTGGGFGGSGLLLGAAGVAAGVGIGLIAGDGGVSDEDFAAAQAAQAAAEAQAAAAAQAQADAEAAQAAAEEAQAAAEAAQAEAEEALAAAEAAADNDAPVSP